MTTSIDGSFAFGMVPSGSATIQVTANSYANYSQTFNASDADRLAILLQRTGGRSGPCGDAPDVSNPVLPIFSSPFAGDFRLVNYFDHDKPLIFVDTNGVQLTSCGDRLGAPPLSDGHTGYDWAMPIGTPLLAVADGDVISASGQQPAVCPIVANPSPSLIVEIRHATTSGRQYSSLYAHMSRIDVTVGQRVTRGQQIGLSGNTGCSTGPHLHLSAYRLDRGRVLVDPYGWEASFQDPWAQDPSGSASVWLWRPGEAPRLRR